MAIDFLLVCAAVFFFSDQRLEQALSDFHRDGFAVIKDFVPRDTCEEMMRRARELVADFDPAEAISVFTTKDQVRTSDRYFLESGDKIRFFLEEEAVDKEGRLACDKERAINKIGHALHALDPLFVRFSSSPGVLEIVRALVPGEPFIVQSMIIFKQPGIGGEVGCHQDATFLYTEPESVVGLWFALEDAHIDNGCLWAIPGGHTLGLKQRFRRDGAGGVKMDILDPSPWPMERLVPLEVPQGTLVLLHGLLPHYSRPNRSPRSRLAFTLHAIDKSAHYPEDNWLRPAGA